jgi:hypothetical protein
VPVIHFLLVYDLDRRELVSQDAFDDAAEAAAAYAELEKRHRLDRGYEIVLVGADSIETIKKTHGQYFGEREPVNPYLVRASAS